MLTRRLRPCLAGIAVTTLGLTCLPGAAAGAERDGLLLDFNGSASQPDLANSGAAEVRTELVEAAGGRASVVERDGEGRALRLASHTGSSPAPMAVIVVRPAGPSDDLSPRAGDFAFGTDFRLSASSQGSSADNGNNLIQRGLFDDTGQYKIQVDRGVVSCRVKGDDGAVLVATDFAVEPRQWYDVRCTRSGGSVTLELSTVQDGERTSWRWQDSGAIGTVGFASARSPLSVGGKVDGDGNPMTDDSDQFNGRVDNVFFSLGG